MQDIATQVTHHQKGRAGAATAQAASTPDPVKDVEGQASQHHLQEMSQQEPGPFDPAAFKVSVHAAIESLAPPATLEEADEYAESGRAGAVKDQLHAIVSGGQSASQHDIKQSTDTDPRTDGLVPKPASPMVYDRVSVMVQAPDAASVIPAPRPPEASDLSAGPAQIDARMTARQLTQDQLASSGEPSFVEVLTARDEARAHAATAPIDYRAAEQITLEQARGDTSAAEAAGVQGLMGSRASAVGRAFGVKDTTRQADQRKREEVTGSILAIHQRTRSDVDILLTLLSTQVDLAFSGGERAARADFERYVDQRMTAYKDDRYSGVIGKGYWVKDRFMDLPDEVNAFYRDGRQRYLDAMDQVVDTIAILVSALLNAARTRIERGRAEVTTYVTGLQGDLAELGRTTAAQLDNRFDLLQSDVDAKRDELVDTVARRAAGATSELDQRIAELKEQNKGLVTRGIEFAEHVGDVIADLGSLLLRVLTKAASVITDIIAHPIRFLGHLIGAVGDGIGRFGSRIVQHLEESLLDLLFGELGSTGIRVPARLDLPGVFDLVLQVLGLTYDKIRDRLVHQLGEPFVARMEQVAGLFVTLHRQGLPGIVDVVQRQVGNLYELVIGKVKEFIVERVVKAGLAYIGALLTPVGAFIKACMTIYDIVMFVVEKARQLAGFVDSVLDSIAAIAAGNVDAAAARIESALAQGLTTVIGFLARLAKLDTVSAKVRSIIEAIRKPIGQTVDRVILAALQLYRRTAGPVVDQVRAGATRVVQSGRDLLKGKPKLHQRDAVAGLEQQSAHPAGRTAEHGAAGNGAAHPADPSVTPAAAPAPLAIHEEFRSSGHQHELYTGAPDGRQLILASGTPTPITNIPDAEGQLAGLNQEYLAARATYEQSLATVAANPGARPGLTRQLEAINAVIRRIVARVRQLRPDDSPLASAPGLGDVRRHGRQQLSLRDEAIGAPAVWALESEHLLPFAVGKMLWDTVGSAIPGRGGAEDDEQTTVMIYKGAADEKTPVDRAVIASFKSQYIDRLAPTALALRRFLLNQRSPGTHSRAHEEFSAAFYRTLSGLDEAASNAITRTSRAVRNEHSVPDDSGQTNGSRRAEPMPLPPDGTLQDASKQQRDDVLRLATRAAERVIGE